MSIDLTLANRDDSLRLLLDDFDAEGRCSCPESLLALKVAVSMEGALFALRQYVPSQIYREAMAGQAAAFYALARLQAERRAS